MELVIETSYLHQSIRPGIKYTASKMGLLMLHSIIYIVILCALMYQELCFNV